MGIFGFGGKQEKMPEGMPPGDVKVGKKVENVETSSSLSESQNDSNKQTSNFSRSLSEKLEKLGDLKSERVESTRSLPKGEKTSLIQMIKESHDFSDLLYELNDWRNEDISELVNHPKETLIRIDDDPDIIKAYNQGLVHWFNNFAEGQRAIKFAQDLGIPVNLNEGKNEEGEIIKQSVDLTNSLVDFFDSEYIQSIGIENCKYNKIIEFAEENDLPIDYSSQELIVVIRKQLKYFCLMGNENQIIELLELSDRKDILSKESELHLFRTAFFEICKMNSPSRLYALFNVMKKRDYDINYEKLFGEVINQMLQTANGFGIEVIEDIAMQNNIKIGVDLSEYSNSAKTGINALFTEQWSIVEKRMEHILRFVKTYGLDNKELMNEKGEEGVDFHELITKLFVQEQDKYLTNVHGLVVKDKIVELAKVFENNDIKLDYKQMFEDYVEKALDGAIKAGSKVDLVAVKIVERNNASIVKEIDDREIDLHIANDQIVEKAKKVVAIDLYKDYKDRVHLSSFYYDSSGLDTLEDLMRPYLQKCYHMNIDLSGNVEDIFKHFIIYILENDKLRMDSEKLNYLKRVEELCKQFRIEIDYSDKLVNDAFARTILRTSSNDKESDDWFQHDLVELYKEKTGKELDFSTVGNEILCEFISDIERYNGATSIDYISRRVEPLVSVDVVEIDFSDEKVIESVQNEFIAALKYTTEPERFLKIYEFIKNHDVKIDFQNDLVKDEIIKGFGRGLSNNDELIVAKVIEIYKDNNVEIDLLGWGESILTNIASTSPAKFPNSLELAWQYGVEVQVEGKSMNEAVANDIYDRWQASFVEASELSPEKVIELIEFYENERGATIDLNSARFQDIFKRALGVEINHFSRISRDDDEGNIAFMIATVTQDSEMFMQYIKEREINVDIDSVLKEQCEIMIFNYIEQFFRSTIDEEELKKMMLEVANFISQMRCDSSVEQKDNFFNDVYQRIYSRAILHQESEYVIKIEQKSNIEVLEQIDKSFGEIDVESENSEEFRRSMLGDRYIAPHFGEMDFATSDVINNFQRRIRDLLENDKFDDAVELYEYGRARIKDQKLADNLFSDAYFVVINNVLEDNNKEKINKYLDRIDEFQELIDQKKLQELRNQLEFGERYNLLYSEITQSLGNNEKSQNRTEAFQQLEELKGRSAVFERIMEELVRAEVWSEELVEQFKSLEGAVGLETALNYLGDYNRHDALLIEQYLVKFYDLSHLTSENDLDENEINKQTKKRRKSLKNLLSQAPMDTSLDYDGNDSRQGLVNVLRNYRSEWFDEFEEEGYFDNIKTFKKQVKMKEKMTPALLRELERIEKEDPVLFAYADKLIMHPTVSVDAIIEFLGNPKVYFEREATHADERLQRELQAGQLCELSDGYSYTIDLTHSEVRDAIVKGQIDEMSPFKPYKYEFEHVVQNQKMAKKQEKYEKLVEQFENDFDDTLSHLQGLKKGFMVKEVKVAVEVFKLIEYIDTEDLIAYTKEFADALMKGAGSQKMKLKKEDFELIENKEDLIEVWSQILYYKDIPWKDFKFLVKKGKLKLKDKKVVDEIENLKFEELEDERKEKLKYAVIEVVKDQAQKYSGKKLIITAEVLAHRDPRYATIGDDTTCCMPFDDGKLGGVYLAYPGCGAMTISFRDPQQEEGDARIAIQSVLTLDKKFEGVSFAQNHKKLMVPGQMRQVFGDEILSKYYESEDVIACDNVEGHKNFINNLISNDNSVIEKIYKKFFRAYRKYIDEFDGKEVVIGKGYSDYLTNLPQIVNEYFLQSLVSYSDKTAEQVYSLLDGEKGEVRQNAGVRELTWRDTIPAAYLQEKTYTAGTNKNETHVEGITNIQKMLVASNLQSVRDDTNSLTIGHFDELSGALDGYTIGYIVNDRSDDGKKKIYAHETVVDPDAQGKGVGRELFTTFLMKIIGDPKLNKLPIVTNLRESTSYEMIKARKHVIEDLGYEVRELENVHHVAGEKFYTFEFTPKEGSKK